MFMKHATISACEAMADRFSLITLEDPALKGAAWTPGEKIQIAMGSAFIARTYTLTEWDAVAGRARVIGYAHGDGPGSAWLHGLKPGDVCDIFGPRRSLDVSARPEPLAVYGDETSIGLAYALLHHDRARAVEGRFEVNDVDASRRVTAHLGLDHVLLFERKKDDAHLEGMEATLPALAAAGATFVLTGKATTIQRLRTRLKSFAVPARGIVTKAYWAPGKCGLD
jgi:NADPH-dependent ferric siderophore reductase